MLKRDEVKILKILFDDLTRDETIMGLSKLLKQKYAQTHRTIKNLAHSGDVKISNVGKSKIVKLDLARNNPNYAIAEIERTNEVCNKNSAVEAVRRNLLGTTKNFICILFGSQAIKPKQDSDIDLLFVISDEYDLAKFERLAKQMLIAWNCDINIVFEKSLHEMWSNPEKLNIGNELLKKHIVLYGAEHFLNLMRQHYVG